MDLSLSSSITRLIPGLIFTVAGFLLSNLYFKGHPLFGLPFFAQTMVGFLSGAFGVFILPYLTAKARDWFVNLVQVTVQTTVAKSMGSFFAAQTKRIQERRSADRSDRSDKSNGSNRSDTSDRREERSVVLDTSAIIDGRIFDVVRAGFIEAPLLVPDFVIREVQSLADSEDELKRQRGRRGLELLKEAKDDPQLKMKVVKKPLSAQESRSKSVDSQLTTYTQKIEGRLATVDFNLNQTVSLEDVTVLNVNELANLVKTVVLPGESLTVAIVQTGKEPDQGVGYLEDGTMVVVEGGRELMGRTVEVVVARLLQTSAGKMIFARTQ